MSETKTKTNAEKRTALYRIITIGLMAALVYVGNFLQIKIPNGVLVTRIHLGNSMCLLAGLLFGGLSGGLSSGIGAALYDLFDPAYILSAPYTFISKFSMGFVSGILRRKGKKESVSVIIAAITGQLTYILLYLLKTYLTIIIIGGTAEAAWIAVGTNALTSVINGVLAVIISVPLYFAISRALKNTGIAALMRDNKEAKKSVNPITIIVAAILSVSMIFITINLSASGKKKAAEQSVQTVSEQQNTQKT